MKDLDILKKNYARLVVVKGVNIQKGQRLAISCPVECADFARLCAAEAYEVGCREVIMLWNDDAISRMRFLYADDDVFDEVAPWDKLRRDIVADEGCAWLSIYAEDPENLKGVPADRITRWQKAAGKAYENFYRHETRNDFQWCVASVPTERWAKAVFPDMPAAQAVERLWQEILRACRVSEDGTIEAWQRHSDELHRHVEQLNSYGFKYLRYKNSIGTDLTVELPEGHFWAGGDEVSTRGIPFSANIPTEEVFTLPRRDGVNGRVVASRPLCLNGNIIEGFSFVIKDGKIVEVNADKGEDMLKSAISLDEGAAYLGEVALVPYDSPISASGILFLNTLFDENAACHMAFGEAYPCIKGAGEMSDDELKARGVNYSMTHEDFMIGTPDLSIIGVTGDGREIPVFVDGNFAF